MKNIILTTLLVFVYCMSYCQWTVQQSNTTNSLESICFINSNTGYIAGSGGTILKTNNGGNNWIKQESGTTNTLTSIYFVDSLNGYAVGYYGTILNTIDGGLHWQIQNSNITSFLSCVKFATKNIGYVISSDTILKTINAGNSWKIIYKDLSHNYDFISAYFIDSSYGYICGSPSLIKTEDGCQTISPTISQPSTYEPMTLFFFNKDTGYIASQYYRSIYKTTDGGNSWIKQVYFTSELNVTGISSLFFTSVDTGYAVGGIGGEPFYTPSNVLLKTCNGGNTWISETSPTSNSLNCVYFPNANVGYACGEKGTIIKMSNSTDTIPVNDTTYATIIDKRSINISPNPAKTNISITSNNKQLFQNASVSITAINGTQVLQQKLNNEKMSIDVSTLSAGLYFVKVWNGSGCWVGRFLKE